MIVRGRRLSGPSSGTASAVPAAGGRRRGAYSRSLSANRLEEQNRRQTPHSTWRPWVVGRFASWSDVNVPLEFPRGSSGTFAPVRDANVPRRLLGGSSGTFAGANCVYRWLVPLEAPRGGGAAHRQVTLPGRRECGEKRTARIRAPRGTAKPTHPLRVSPTPIRLSKSVRGVWHTPALKNSGAAMPVDGTTDTSPEAVLS